MLETVAEHNVHVWVLMYIFEDQMCTFGYLKIPDIILSPATVATVAGDKIISGKDIALILWRGSCTILT